MTEKTIVGTLTSPIWLKIGMVAENDLKLSHSQGPYAPSKTEHVH